MHRHRNHSGCYTSVAFMSKSTYQGPDANPQYPEQIVCFIELLISRDLQSCLVSDVRRQYIQSKADDASLSDCRLFFSPALQERGCETSHQIPTVSYSFYPSAGPKRRQEKALLDLMELGCFTRPPTHIHTRHGSSTVRHTHIRARLRTFTLSGSSLAYKFEIVSVNFQIS